MAIRRSTRAGMKYLHIIEGATEEELDAYRERNQDSTENPLNAVTDYYSSKPGSLQTVQGDANLGEITDVRHHISTMWLSSPVPMALLGYGEDLNRDVLEEQTDQYHSALESITGWIEDELVVPLLERQWLLAGIWPENLDYNIEWASKKTVSTQTLTQLAQAVGLMSASGLFTDETIYRTVARFLPGFDWRAELEAIEQKREEEQQNQDALDQIAAELTRANRQEPEPETAPEDEEPEDEES
jgi:hypothetical protein